ncbi:MAG: CRISPR-associated helicase Cas3' [Candidatus Odinarchaeota archaeon]
MGFSCKKYSHQNKLLLTHLNDVGILCKEYAIKGGAPKEICDLAEIIGKSHDFGKYTSFFQKHLNNERVQGDLYKHSFLSAIFTSWLTIKRFNNLLLPALTFLCVYSHHGELKSFRIIRDIIDSPTPNYILKQVETIKNEIDYITKELENIGLKEAFDFINNFESCFSEVKSKLKTANAFMKLKLNENDRWQLYYDTLFLYSCLIDADKKDAGLISKIQAAPSYNLTSDIILNYINKSYNRNPTMKIDKIRQSIFSDIQNNLKNILNTKSDKSNIYTITAPTGTGKTLSGVYSALELKNALAEGQHKIVYCLPYINIIEQNHSTLKKVLKTYYNNDPEISLLLKYHHLSFPPIDYKEDEKHLDEFLLLVDSWESEIVVTTFEQLFRTLIGCKNSQLKKLHNLAGSVIILDEIQAIPLEYWKLVRDVLINFVEKLHSTIIMMTATMPTIFKGEELLTDSQSYFEKLERVQLIPSVKEAVNYEGLVEFFFRVWNGKDSALIVLNTIKTSKKVYKKISERLGEKAIKLTSNIEKSACVPEKIILAYLSTSVLPIERLKRIEQLKNFLKEERPVILVSTQVVEAGVDLDFDMAIRDIGPLDSIVQVAGRCNRHWKKKLGNVFILRVIDEHEKEDSRKIYGQILTNISRKILEGKDNIGEKILGGIVKSYFNEISYRMNIDKNEKSEEILQQINQLNFKELSNFSLIHEESKIPVYIELNNDAEHQLEEFQAILKKWEKIDHTNLKEVFEYKALLRTITAKMENYIVEVYDKDENLKNLKQIAEHLKTRLIPHKLVEYYYDIETGYKSSEDKEKGPLII